MVRSSLDSLKRQLQSNSSEGAVERMRDARINGWAQSSLLPAERLRIALTVHVSARSDRAEVGVLVTDHLEDVTLGIYSTSVPLGADYQEVGALVVELLVNALQEHHAPF